MGEGEALHLLDKKWIKPITDGLNAIPIEVIDQMVIDIVELKNKYSTTYENIEESKRVSSTTLVNMIGMLTGNAYDIDGLNEFKKFMEGNNESK